MYLDKLHEQNFQKKDFGILIPNQKKKIKYYQLKPEM